jgi:hypothetical protein
MSKSPTGTLRTSPVLIVLFVDKLPNAKRFPELAASKTPTDVTVP